MKSFPADLDEYKYGYLTILHLYMDMKSIQRVCFSFFNLLLAHS